MVKTLWLKHCRCLVILVVLSWPLTTLAQAIFFETANVDVQKNTVFSLPLKVNTAEAVFAINFDLNYNPALIQFINATEGNFLNQSCQTSLMATENPAGKLIFGLTRLGASCGGVNGSGILATINFKSLNQAGAVDLSFSNSAMCVLSGASCNFVTGAWTGSVVNIKAAGSPLIISSVAVSLITANSATISWTTDKLSDSQVEYGLTSAYGQQTSADSTLRANHVIVLNNLNPGAFYYFRIWSKDVDSFQVISSGYTLATLSVDSRCSGGNPAGRP